MRKLMKKRRDSKIFRRTAQKTAVANLNSTSFRGGIRL